MFIDNTRFHIEIYQIAKLHQSSYYKNYVTNYTVSYLTMYLTSYSTSTKFYALTNTTRYPLNTKAF